MVSLQIAQFDKYEMRVVLPIRDFKFFISVYFVIALIGLSMASIYEDEDRVNSEGMWQKPSKHLEPKMSASTGQGNSRFGKIL